MLFLISIPSFAQYNQANIWYFGNGNSIDFNQNPPKKIEDGLFFEGRINTICDNNGKLLFYTDGMVVLNKNHKIMKNGKYLLGHADNIIVPFPNNQNLYYIFSISIFDSLSLKNNFGKISVQQDTSKGQSPQQYAFWEDQQKREQLNQKKSKLYYHIVDIQKNEIIEKNKFLYKKVKADLVVARHANNKDYWLITHEFMTNKFKVFLINEKGLQEKPIETEIGMKLYDESNLHLFFFLNNGKTNQMSISANFEKIAITDYQHKKTEIFNFDNITGKIINSFILNYDLDFAHISGLEFSPDGSKLYLLHRNPSYSINEPFVTFLCYDIKNKNKIIKYKKEFFSSLNQNIDVKNKIFQGDLRIAPDGKMYVSNRKNHVSVIHNPNSEFDSLKIDYLKYLTPVYWNLPKVAHLLPPFYSPIKLGNLFQREILFETGKYDLKTWHYPILTDIVKFLKENPKTTINIFGHTDNEGNSQANKTLSLQRAKAVENYFISQNIAKNRIISEGFGDTKPLLDNATPENKRKNRRIEFLVK